MNIAAKGHNLERESCICKVGTFSKRGYEVTLGAGYAPLSLVFSISNNGKLVLNDSLIFHGPHAGYGNGGAPTL